MVLICFGGEILALDIDWYSRIQTKSIHQILHIKHISEDSGRKNIEPSPRFRHSNPDPPSPTALAEAPQQGAAVRHGFLRHWPRWAQQLPPGAGRWRRWTAGGASVTVLSCLIFSAIQNRISYLFFWYCFLGRDGWTLFLIHFVGWKLKFPDLSMVLTRQIGSGDCWPTTFEK